MVVQVHGFDWTVYTDRVMPAFGKWLLERDDSPLYNLFKETRCAREEAFIPAPLQRARIWPRAKTFAETLPLGPYSRREYEKLCSAEQFTTLSDRYIYKHAPQLYQNPEPIRALWGALVETYCLPWSQTRSLSESTSTELDGEFEDETFLSAAFAPAHVERSEVLALLREAGLGDLTHETNPPAHTTEDLRTGGVEGAPATQPLLSEQANWEDEDLAFMAILESEEDQAEEIEEYTQPMPGGILLGTHPNTLQLRGWMASVSLHALALFEYLACGRRTMPFGYEPSEPYGVFIGYLTTDEVWRLGTSLRGISDPAQTEAEADYLRFRYQNPNLPESYRLIDEILPTYAADLHHAIDMAAAQGLGLICSVE